MNILPAGIKDYSRINNITRGNEILLAGTNYYSRECNITRGNELLLAGQKYYSRERIITRGNLYITRGDDVLLAGEKYWQYMAPEGFRTIPHVSLQSLYHNRVFQNTWKEDETKHA